MAVFVPLIAINETSIKPFSMEHRRDFFENQCKPESTGDMNLHIIRIMQILHLAMLVFIPFLFSIFRMVSEPYDPLRVRVDSLVFIGGGLLSGYALVFFIITGKSDNALPSLLKLYRNTLSRFSFLVVSNIVLISVSSLLIHQFLFYRQVEFLSPIDVELYLADDLNKPERLAFIRARTPTYLRLPIKPHMIVVKDLATQQWVESQHLDVPSVVKKPGVLNVWINPKREQYETVD